MLDIIQCRSGDCTTRGAQGRGVDARLGSCGDDAVWVVGLGCVGGLGGRAELRVVPHGVGECGVHVELEESTFEDGLDCFSLGGLRV